MPNPSLLSHYRIFNTTTIWSAANISEYPTSDCFLFRFCSAMLTSLVPYDSLYTVLANFTPVIMYPVIRSSGTLCRKHKRNCLLLITTLPYRGFIIGSLSFNSCTFTYSYQVAVFLYRSAHMTFGICTIKWFGSYS
jgi:hypothetical protein